MLPAFKLKFVAQPQQFRAAGVSEQNPNAGMPSRATQLTLRAQPVHEYSGGLSYLYV